MRERMAKTKQVGQGRNFSDDNWFRCICYRTCPVCRKHSRYVLACNIWPITYSERRALRKNFEEENLDMAEVQATIRSYLQTHAELRGTDEYNAWAQELFLIEAFQASKRD